MPSEIISTKDLEAFVDEHRKIVKENEKLRQALRIVADHNRAITDVLAEFYRDLKTVPDIFLQKVEAIDTGVKNYLFENFRLVTIRDIVSKSENDLLIDKPIDGKQGFGKESVRKLRRFLATQSLRLGMSEEEILTWTPPDASKPLFPRR